MGMCGGDGGGATYQESAGTQALNAKNLALLERQEAYDAEIKPFLEQDYGYMRDNGVLRKMTDDEKYANMSQSEKNTYDIGQLAAQRQKDAYEGKLPLDEGTLQAKQDEFNAVKEGLSRTGTKLLGTSFEDATSNSTAGAQNIANRLKYWKAREDAMSRGEIDTGTSNMLNMFNANNQYGLQNALGTTNLGGYGQGLLSSYGQLGSRFAQQDAMSNQVAMFNSQQQAQKQAGMMQGVGSLIGAGGTIGAAALLA